MSYFLYAPLDCPEWETLIALLRDSSVGMPSGHYRSVGALIDGLRSALGSVKIGIICAKDKQDIEDLLVERDWLRSFQFVLVLADPSAETTTLGYKLHPRVLLAPADCENLLVPFLEKLLKRYKTPEAHNSSN